ncbi:MAG: hypothetical protein P8J32_01305 [bacterium]|nr:hypothetical protein [bacterium]
MGATKEFWINMMVPFYRDGIHVGYIRPDGEIVEPKIEDEVKPFSKGTVY